MCSINPQEMVSSLLAVVENSVVVERHFFGWHKKNFHGSTNLDGSEWAYYCLFKSYSSDCSQTDIALDP